MTRTSNRLYTTCPLPPSNFLQADRAHRRAKTDTKIKHRMLACLWQARANKKSYHPKRQYPALVFAIRENEKDLSSQNPLTPLQPSFRSSFERRSWTWTWTWTWTQTLPLPYLRHGPLQLHHLLIIPFSPCPKPSQVSRAFSQPFLQAFEPLPFALPLPVPLPFTFSSPNPSQTPPFASPNTNPILISNPLL